MLFSLFLCFVSLLLHIFIDNENQKVDDVKVRKITDYQGQSPRLGNIIKKNVLTIAIFIGKIVVPTIDLIFTTIFIGIGIIILVFDETNGCE